ncbi:MAG: tetratricopeptide repeat protein [Candidatus Margulisiibacteriota bacterium]
MNFKALFIFLFLISNLLWAFPERTPEQISIQKSLTQQINESPNNPALRFELAMEYASSGWIELGWDQLKLVPKLSKDYQNVVFDKYLSVIEKKPLNWQAHFRLAFAYYFKNDKQKAIESFKTVLKIKPDHIWSMGLIALILGEQKKYNECIEWCKKALRINDDATAIHFLLGSAYYETGNFLGVLGESLSVGRLKSIEAKYRPIPPRGIE